MWDNLTNSTKSLFKKKNSFQTRPTYQLQTGYILATCLHTSSKPATCLNTIYIPATCLHTSYIPAIYQQHTSNIPATQTIFIDTELMVILLLYHEATNRHTLSLMLSLEGGDPSQAVLNVSNVDLLSSGNRGVATAIATDRSARLWDPRETSRS